MKYTPDIAEQILSALRRGLSVRTISKMEGMPAYSTVFDWLAQHADFAEGYKRARVAGCEAIVDEIFEIADDGRNDWVERYNWRSGLTEKVFDHENVLRSRLRAADRKWYLSKLMPHLYGDRVEHEHKELDALATRLNEGRQRALGVSPQSPGGGR